MTNYIDFTIPTNEDYWQPEDEVIPNTFFEKLEEEISNFIEEIYPDFEISIIRVPETLSHNNRTRTSLPDDEQQMLIETVDDWLSHRWPDWLGESYVGMYVIEDWTGKRLFTDKGFDSFEDGWGFICEHFEDDLDSNDEHFFDDFYVVLNDE